MAFVVLVCTVGLVGTFELGQKKNLESKLEFSLYVHGNEVLVCAITCVSFSVIVSCVLAILWRFVGVLLISSNKSQVNVCEVFFLFEFLQRT